jgi:hypothetical protein
MVPISDQLSFRAWLRWHGHQLGAVEQTADEVDVSGSL